MTVYYCVNEKHAIVPKMEKAENGHFCKSNCDDVLIIFVDMSCSYFVF